jgi:hypothetical protein
VQRKAPQHDPDDESRTGGRPAFPPQAPEVSLVNDARRVAARQGHQDEPEVEGRAGDDAEPALLASDLLQLGRCPIGGIDDPASPPREIEFLEVEAEERPENETEGRRGRGYADHVCTHHGGQGSRQCAMMRFVPGDGGSGGPGALDIGLRTAYLLTTSRFTERTLMDRNRLYVVIGLLAVVVLVMGVLYYQERQKRSGVEINVDKSGISIQQN